LSDALANDGSAQRAVFQGYQHLLRTRVSQPAFHPDAEQIVFETSDPAVLAFLRTATDAGQAILVAANLGSRPKRFQPADHTQLRYARELISGKPIATDGTLDLEPYQVVWAEAMAQSAE